MDKLNPSFKHHLLVALFISVWVFVFTFYIRPFDGVDSGLNLWWLFLSVGFSIIFFLSYFVSLLVQDSIYQSFFKWNALFELGVVLLFLFIAFYGTYLYYKSPFLYGILSFGEYLNVYLKSAIIFIPVLLLSRKYIVSFIPDEPEVKKNQENLIIKGDYKFDELRVAKSDLICVSKSQNYVEVFFIQNGNLESKLIRSSLKKMKYNFNFLVQVHRSHLINPMQFKSWKNQNTILVNQKEVPVSKNYKQNILVI